MANRYIRESLSLSFTFEDVPTAEDVQALIALAYRVGHVAAMTSNVESTETAYNLIVTRVEFNAHPLVKALFPAWRTRVWDMSQRLQTDYQRHSHEGPLDLEVLLSKIRLIEAGEAWHVPGRATWDVLAGLINERLADEGMPLVLPWDNTIHMGLQGGISRREESAELLEARYQALEHELAQQRNQEKLF